jgi:hypothetical protein
LPRHRTLNERGCAFSTTSAAGTFNTPVGSDAKKVTLYTHGGGFAAGSAASHRKLARHSSEVVFIVEGTARAEYQDGTFLTAGVGACVEAPAGVAHRNLGPSWKQSVGVSVDPAKMTQPVNKAVVAKTV